MCIESTYSAYLGQYRPGTDIKHGRGALLEKLIDGNCYLFEGYFYNGVKTGYGRITYWSGAYYEGDWKNGQTHGKGTLVYEVGSVDGRVKYEGDFDNNEVKGHGVLVYKDGSKFIGQFANGKREGYGKMVTPYHARF